MEKTLQTLRWYLSQYMARLLLIALLCAVGGVILSDLAFYSTGGFELKNVVQTLPYELIATVFAWIAGGSFFIPQFKMALANGVSRKTYLLACLPAIAAFAAALSIFGLILAWVHSLFWPAVLITNVFYPLNGWFGVALVQFAAYFLMTVFGCFIAILMYRSNGLARWVLLLAPVWFYIILVADASDTGRVMQALIWYLRLTLGFVVMEAPNPYIAVLSLSVYAFITSGIIYLMMRRVPLKME